VHLILDNYGTHKTQGIRRWLAKRPRFHLHFTPTSASWLNRVERWFAELTEKQIRRRIHRSTPSWNRLSAASSSTATSTRNPLSGPNRPTKSWNRSARFCKRTLDSAH